MVICVPSKTFINLNYFYLSGTWVTGHMPKSTWSFNEGVTSSWTKPTVSNCSYIANNKYMQLWVYCWCLLLPVRCFSVVVNHCFAFYMHFLHVLQFSFDYNRWTMHEDQ